MKDYSKGSLNVFVHLTPNPKSYGSLNLLLSQNGLAYSNYVKKDFPFLIDGYPVYKIKVNRGRVIDYMIDIILINLKDHNEFGNHIVKFNDDFDNVIGVHFKYSGGFFEVVDASYKNKEGSNLCASLNLQKIQKALNGSKK